MGERVNDEQPADLSQVGSGAWKGLPPNEIEVEVVKDMHGENKDARNMGEVSLHRTSEDH